MGLLTGTAYDPASAGSIVTSAAAAMTAIDTTNLRLTFTAPLNGVVRVRLRCVTTGASTAPAILLGVLDHTNGDVVKGRVAPHPLGKATTAASQQLHYLADFLVGGLTPGTSYTFDAARGVETGVASTTIKYGGPDDTTTNNAFGAFTFEIHDAPSVLAQTLYDPGTSASASVASLLAMTALDTTNLRLTFTAPASGNVLVRMQAPMHGGTVGTMVKLYGVLDGATVKARQRSTVGVANNTIVATDFLVSAALMLVTGLTPGQSYTWDAAYGVEVVGASTSIVWGGANDTTADNAFGGFTYEIHDARAFTAQGALLV